jgi:hypothetical protein
MDPALLACPPELLADTLQNIRAQYGSIREYLIHNGATRADLDRLQQLLVAPTGANQTGTGRSAVLTSLDAFE